jgi:hypothetical protein
MIALKYFVIIAITAILFAPLLPGYKLAVRKGVPKSFALLLLLICGLGCLLVAVILVQGFSR